MGKTRHITLAGMAKCPLFSGLEPGPARDEEQVEAAVLYLRTDEVECVWVALDFMDLNRRLVDLFADAIEAVSGIRRVHIHILSTHNHGGGEKIPERLAELIGGCVLAARESACPAFLKFASVDLPDKVSFIRRVYVPELCASVTAFFGADASDGFDASPHIECSVRALERGELAYCGRAETRRAYQPFPDADRRLTAFSFVDDEGKTIGTVVRFAAHAVCSNNTDFYSADYPYWVRRYTEEALGGTAMFVNGPCADIAPALKAKRDGTARRLGRYLADAACRLLNDAVEEEIVLVKDAGESIALPVRKEVLEGRVSLPWACLPTSLPDRLRYLEAERTRETLPFLTEKYSEGEENPGSMVDVSMGLLRLNRHVLAAFPGETFSATAASVAKAINAFDITTLTEHGRTVMYLPPKNELERGGYETVCRLTDAGAAEILEAEAIRHLRRFLNQ